MKKMLVAFLSLLSLVSYGKNDEEKIMYVYSNDGDFNAFFYSDIDSITITSLNNDDNDTGSVFIQNIWTKDSLYRIPVSSIDSVSLVRPKNILRANAICIDSLIMSYVESYDTTSLYVLSTIKPELLPQKDDVLYSFSYNNPLPEGFLGKVKSITNELGKYKIECEIADLSDVYEKYVFYYSGTVTTGEVSNSSRRKEQGDLIHSFHFSLPIPTIGGNIECELGYLDNITTINYYDERRQITKTTHKQKIFLSLIGNVEVDTPYSSGKLLWEAPSPLYLPIPYTPFGVYIQPGFGLDLNGKLGLGGTFAFSNTTEEIQVNGEESKVKDSGWHVDSNFERLSLSGEVFPYFNLAISVGLPLQIVSGGIDVRFGVKLKGGIDIAIVEDSPYETFKDSKVSAEYVASVHPLISVLGHKWERFDLCVDRRYSHHTNDGYDMYRFNFWERYLFPEFNSIWVDVDDNKKATISVNVLRDILFSHKVGVGLYDNNSNLIGASYASIKYNETGFQNPMEFEFPKLQPGMTYTARPIISWLGGTIAASPKEEFKIDAIIRTIGISDITSDGATCYGYTEEPQENNISIDFGICYDSEKIPVIGQSPYVSAKTSGAYSVRLTELKEKTTYWYRAYLNVNGNVYYGETDMFTTKGDDICPDNNHPHWIDLGLPSGTQWRCCNEGASTPEAYGGYYTFGQVNSAPTIGQIQELINNTTSVWTTRNGITGRKITSSNGKSIFLPAAGLFDNVFSKHYEGTYGIYWSSTPSNNYTDMRRANASYFTNELFTWYDWQACDCSSTVRSVRR